MQRRRKRLVRPDVQLRVVLIAFAVASLSLFLVFHLSFTAIWAVTEEWGAQSTAAMALEDLKSQLVNQFLLSGFLALPLAMAIGILYSFKFAGPLYRFKSFLLDLSTGPWNARCRIRSGDDLQDILEAVNDALDPLQTFLEENRSLLVQTRSLIASGILQPGDEGAEQVRALGERIDEALATFEERLPSEEESLLAPERSEEKVGGEEEKAPELERQS